MRRCNLALLFLALPLIGCASRPSSANEKAPTDAQLVQLVQRLATMPGRIVPAGPAYLFEADTLLTRPIAAADVRAVPLLVDCLSDTTASEVGLPHTGDYVVTVAAVCFQVLLSTEFYQTRASAQTWPAGFEPFVSYDAPPERWVAAQAAWKAYLATQRER